MLPGSLRSVAGVRAARTEEKIGHSGRDERRGALLNEEEKRLEIIPEFIGNTRNGSLRNLRTVSVS